MIQLDKLTRKYGSFTAIEDVSFNIAQGEIVGLLGHNGAGKTTIMKTITGLLEPTSGVVWIDGMDVREKRRDVQAKIGYLSENCPLYEEMVVIDYLEYMAILKSISTSLQRESIQEVLRKTELMTKADQPISSLSRGYCQRVGVAQAILGKPEIIILDEPTNGLDPSQIQHMRELITELSQKSTVIISTHILQEVQAICDRVIIIVNGRVALDSRVEELQKSSRLLISLDGETDELRSVLSGLNSVQTIEFLKTENGRNSFAIEMKQNDYENNLTETAPEVAKAIIDNGFRLFALHHERRDLETVFREINTRTKDANDV